MQRLILALAVSGALLSGQAMAADAVVAESVAVAPPPPSEWTGFYFGGHAGWVWDKAQWTITEDNWWTNGPGAAASMNSNGFLGGGQVGYIHQLPNNFVIGADISASYTDISRSIVSPEFSFDTWQVGIDWILLAQGRIGYAVDKFHYFVQGGYAGADVTATAFPIFGGGTASVSEWEDGWTIGIGASYMATDRLSFGAEYNYVDLGTATYNIQGSATPDFVSVDHQLHAVKLTLNLHFGN